METNRADRVADLDATLAYYKALRQLAKRVPLDRRGPEVPPVSELRLVDGWLTRNGRPVWHAATAKLIGNQLRAVAHDRPRAEAAWLSTFEQRTPLLQDPDHAGDALRVNAIIDYYESLATQAQRAMHEDAPVPEVPDRTDLELVGDWLMWKGQPVWWLGQRVTGEAARAADQPAPAPVATPSSAAQTRPKRRRLLRLPWQRAAA